jgi:hypothetical protein
MNARIPEPEVQDSDFGAFEAATATLDKAWSLPSPKDLAVSHYTALAAQAQAWSDSLQPLRTQEQMRDETFSDWDDEAYDPTDDPRTWTVTPVDGFDDDATKLAAEEVLASPYTIALWLHEDTGNDCTEALDVIGLKRLHPSQWTIQQALVMVMNGTNQQTLDAVHRLRELWDESAFVKQSISDAAGDILCAYAQRRGHQ